MADQTHIEWTDATWNPITGCSVVSAGCKHCYAMKLAGTRLAHHPSRAGLTAVTKAGPVWTGEVRFNEEWLDQPLRWRRPRRIFVCAHGDLFHESIPLEWIYRVFAVMAKAPQHTFQVLTKRPERMLNFFMHASLVGAPVDVPIIPADHWPLPNVWLGVSVEDQAAAESRIPVLLQCPAVVRWISAEPLLGPVDLLKVRAIPPQDLPFLVAGTPLCNDRGCGRPRPHYPREHGCRWGIAPMHGSLPGLDWVVAGGESGRGARPMHPNWARSLRDQCAAAGVPFLFKQWGDWEPLQYIDALNGTRLLSLAVTKDEQILADLSPGAGPNQRVNVRRVGKKAAGRTLDGTLHDAYPRTP